MKNPVFDILKACLVAAIIAFYSTMSPVFLSSVAHAQSLNDYTLDNLNLDFAGQIMALKQVSVTGASLSKSELLALLDAKAAEPLAARLAKLNIKSMRIPELIVEKTTPLEKQMAVYRNVEISNIVEGRIEQITSETGTLTVTRGKDVMKGTFGKLAIANTDMPQIARVSMDLYDPKKPEDLKALYGSFTLRDLAFTDPKKTDIKIEEISGSDFRARPIEGSWQATLPKMEALEDIKDENVKLATSLKFLSEIFSAVSVGSIEMKGIEAVNKQADNAVFSLKRLGYTKGTLTLEGLGIIAKDGKGTITEITIGNFMNSDAIPALRELSEKPFEEITAEEWRKVLVLPGLIRFSGLDFDVPQTADKKGKNPTEPKDGKKPERVRFTLKTIALTADKPVNNIPTDMGVAVENFNFTIPDDAKESGLKDLLAMGYKTIDMSMGMAAQWSEASSELTVKDISMRGADMGSFMLSGLLGNITKDSFSPDTAISTVALLGANAKNIKLNVENKGLYEKLLNHFAKQQKTTAEDLRRQYGMMAAMALPSVLGDSEQAKAITQAISRFIAKPGTLKLDLKAKEGGIGFADFAAVEQPGDLLKKVDVTAVAD
jgi:hypothetical protein